MIEFVKSEAHRLKMTVVWSWQGWWAAWETEKTLRQWTLANALSILLALALDLSPVERALIIGFGLLILVAELLNTAIEETVNRISYVDHHLSKKAKDIGSAAVAVTAIAAGLVWLIILVG
ncbi:MAG: diacylglycerol kinase [Rhodobacter sp.]|nr:diacylglycerol kinase [Rhodobacter sp.]